jgi:hypothetical protein
MRWNCPHCGVALAIANEKLGAGWAFSRCYHCGGFALIRRTDVNIIKIDQAPPGEAILLPEASENPLLSEEATQHLFSARPVVKPGKRSVDRISIQDEPSSPPPFLRTSLLSRDLPSPLPETTDKVEKKRWLKFGIGFSALLATGSGVYLYIQGQELWKKAWPTAQAQAKEASTSMAALIEADVVQAPALHAEVVDQLQHDAAEAFEAPGAPEAPPPVLAPAPVKIRVVPKYKSSPLRAGPGLNYPVLGLVNPEFQYFVEEWKNDWFKVTLEAPEAGSVQALLTPKNPTKPLPKTAWIRNDLVQRMH